MFSSVQDEVMAKSESNSNERKKIVFTVEFHSLGHLEGCCFIHPFSILGLKELFFLVSL